MTPEVDAAIIPPCVRAIDGSSYPARSNDTRKTELHVPTVARQDSAVAGVLASIGGDSGCREPSGEGVGSDAPRFRPGSPAAGGSCSGGVSKLIGLGSAAEVLPPRPDSPSGMVPLSTNSSMGRSSSRSSSASARRRLESLSYQSSCCGTEPDVPAVLDSRRSGSFAIEGGVRPSWEIDTSTLRRGRLN